MRRMLSMLLALTMVLSMAAGITVSVGAEGEYIYLEGAQINGSPIPQLQVGDTLPERSYTVPEGANYTVETYWWKNGTPVPAGTAVENGNDYKLWIDVYAKEGYAFTHGFPLMINGEEYSFMPVNSRGEGFEGCRFSQNYPFLTPISKVELSYAEPVVGQPLSDIIIAEDALYTVDMDWYGYNENDWIEPGTMVEKGNKYYGELDACPAAGYMFTADTEVWVNGERITEDYGYNHYMTYNDICIYTRYYDFTEAVAEAYVTYTEPVVGQPLPMPVAGTGNYVVDESNTGWYDYTTGQWMSPGDMAEKGHIYYLDLWVAPAEGYKFTDDAKLYVNGALVEHNEGSGGCIVWSSEDYDFCDPVAKVELTFAEPVQGQTLPIPTVSGENVTLDWYWYETITDERMAEGDVAEKGCYELNCIIDATVGYKITEDTQFYVNGEQLILGDEVEYNGRFIAYCSDCYSFLDKISAVSVTLADPVLGQPFPEAVIPADANYTVTTTWLDGYTNEIVTGNVGNNVYSVTIEITPATGCAFVEEPSVTFNGKAQSDRDYDLLSSLSLYEVYSFAEIIDKIEVFYEKPEVGKAPGAVTIPEGANYTLNEQRTGWFYSRNREKVTGVFEDGYRYYMEARVEVAPGYQLKQGVTEIWINGEKYIYNGGGGNWLDTAVTIPGEEFSLAQSIDKVELPAWPELKVGDELPDITGETEYYVYYYSWDAIDAEGDRADAYTVKENMVYCVNLIAEPKAGCEFGEDAVVTVGGEPVSNWGQVNHSSIYDCKVYNFGGAKEVKSLNVITSVPGIGQAGGVVTISTDAGYILVDSMWGVASDTTYEDAKECSEPYKAGDRVLLIVDLKAMPGYIFDSEATITVNGKKYPIVDQLSFYNYMFAFLDLGEVKKNAEYNGLVVVDGVWRYYEGGVFQKDYTGLVPYGDKIFYVENGILDFTYTGLAWYNNAWTYVANSQLTEGYTGLVWFEGEWFYVVDSVIDWTFTGLVPYEGNYFYVQNNHLDWSYTGLGYHDGGWYFIQNGLLQKEYSGLVYFNDNWFYVEEGVLTYQYFGMVEYQGNLFYVQASHLDWSYTGLGYHEGNWYYFQNALYTPSFTGLVPFNGSLFYVKDGTIDWSFNGEAEYGGTTYTVVNGAVQ